MDPMLLKGYIKLKTQVKDLLKEQLDKSYGQVTITIKHLERIQQMLDHIHYEQTKQTSPNTKWLWQ